MKISTVLILFLSLAITLPFLGVAELEDVEFLAIGMGKSPFLDFFRIDMENYYFIAPDQQFLHPYLLKLMSFVGLEGKFWYRFPSALFFALGNGVAFLFFRQYFSRLVAFMLVTIMICNTHLLYWATYTRFYTMTVAFCFLQYFLISKRDQYSKMKFEAAFLMVSLLAFCLNIMSILLTGPAIIYLLFNGFFTSWKKRLFLVFCFIYTVFKFSLAFQYRFFGRGFGAPRVNPPEDFWSKIDFVDMFFFYSGRFDEFQSGLFPALLVFVSLIGLALSYWKCRKLKGDESLFRIIFLVSLFLSILVTYILRVEEASSRYYFVAIPAILFFTGKMLERIGKYVTSFLVGGFLIFALRELPHVITRDYLPSISMVQDYSRELLSRESGILVSDRPFPARAFLLPGLKPLDWDVQECQDIDCLISLYSEKSGIIYLQLDETISESTLNEYFFIKERKKFAGKYSVPYRFYVLDLR